MILQSARRTSHRTVAKRARNSKILVAALLALPLVLSAVPPAALENGYRATVRFQTVFFAPSETMDEELGAAARSWFTTRLHLDHARDRIAAFGFAESGSCRNTFRLFYTQVPLRKWTGVFVI